ncbi:hypothetical protein EB796_023510 [Bugula neritina]|uniref:C2H2-type domain-containing protein n=1 Tax=Bugula neritina TaxID=10212 RepID=A0A7J7IXN6_BUGNE|nr:hypothetical protein EB796_023510 [Bugula neritina]
MDTHESSPFLNEFLLQVDLLYTAFRNLPVEEYSVALDHLHSLLERLEYHCEGSSETTDSTDLPSNTRGQADNGCSSKTRRRKIARPRRSSEIYDAGEEDEELEKSAECKLGSSRKVAIVPNPDVGCQVVTDFKGDERFQCDQCELKFSYYAALLRHLDARHKTFDANQKIQETNKRAVSCGKCGATLSSKGALHAHMHMHSGKQPFTCDVCNKKFSLKSNLLRHKKIHEGLKPYQCDICHKRFTEKRSVEVHRRIHTGERPYRCDVCGMRFSSWGHGWVTETLTRGRVTLRINVTFVTSPSPSELDFTITGNDIMKRIRITSVLSARQLSIAQVTCFCSTEELRLHVLTHTGLKPYLCSECGKCFSRQQTLKNHMKQHSCDVTVYSCEWCPDAFTSAQALSRHKMSHKSGTDAVTPEVDGLVDDVINEELDVLPKEMLAAYCDENTSSQDILEAISRTQMF